MKKQTEKKTEHRSPVSAEAAGILAAWLDHLPGDFGIFDTFQGAMIDYTPADFSAGRSVGRFVEICAKKWIAIFDIDELRAESKNRYYSPIKRLLELMICHPYYWRLLHHAISHELEKMDASGRASMLAEIDALDQAQYPDDIRKQLDRFRVTP